MNILIGLAIWLVFFIFIGLSFYLGYRVGSRAKPKTNKLTDEKLEELKRRKQGLQNMMNYDIKQALGGGK
jgi:hypothetical protein